MNETVIHVTRAVGAPNASLQGEFMVLVIFVLITFLAVLLVTK